MQTETTTWNFSAAQNSFERMCSQALMEIGEDPTREGLVRTPHRFRKAFHELTRGYSMTAREAVGEGIFESESSGPVFVKEIEFFSLCEHHLLPFWGKVTIGYVPEDKILGLSKLARVVEVFARRLQVQERLTKEIAESISELVGARAVSVIVEASHMCMAMRGVSKPGSMTRTEFNLGVENLNELDRSRFMKGMDS